MNMPFASPNATYLSDCEKSYVAGCGCTISHFSTFSGVIVLNCAFTSAAPFASMPENWLAFSAAPTRK